MKKVTVQEMRSSLTRLEELVTEEGELIITRHGRAIARVLPPGRAGNMPSHARLRARQRRLARPSEELVREDRDGRP